MSVAEAIAERVRLSDGTASPTRSLIWCVGVRPEPLVQGIGLATIRQGRLVVDEYLAVPGQPDLWACGDVAAVPDLTRPGEITPMTAQHAQRQGKRAAGNIAATFGRGTRRPYKHHDLGFVVDLGGFQAAANPLQVPLSGLPAKTVTRGYHLLSLPGNRGERRRTGSPRRSCPARRCNSDSSGPRMCRWTPRSRWPDHRLASATTSAREILLAVLPLRPNAGRVPLPASRSSTRRILPLIVFGRSVNSSRRIRLYGARCSRQ